MNDSPAPYPTERLLGEFEWMRALAARIVRDEHAAEEALQDSWVTLLRRRRAPGSTSPGWFATVVRSSARQAARSASSRARRERQVARGEALASPVETLERAELHARLVQAILALHEPYRTAILQHWFDGHSASEIARARGVPASTVRRLVAAWVGSPARATSCAKLVPIVRG